MKNILRILIILIIVIVNSGWFLSKKTEKPDFCKDSSKIDETNVLEYLDNCKIVEFGKELNDYNIDDKTLSLVFCSTTEYGWTIGEGNEVNPAGTKNLYINKNGTMIFEYFVIVEKGKDPVSKKENGKWKIEGKVIFLNLDRIGKWEKYDIEWIDFTLRKNTQIKIKQPIKWANDTQYFYGN